MTTMTISNLSHTVSKNDISVSSMQLCVCVCVCVCGGVEGAGNMSLHSLFFCSPLSPFLLQELCGAVGSLESVAMPAPGVAEVVFKYKNHALEAFKKYNQRNLDGQPMICKL